MKCYYNYEWESRMGTWGVNLFSTFVAAWNIGPPTNIAVFDLNL